MKNVEAFNKLSRSFHRIGFEIKRNSPVILVTAGIVGVVASTVMACKATTKISDILDKTKEQVDMIHECENNTELVESGEYTEKDVRKDLTKVYFNTGFQLVKLYLPAALLGSVSIAGIVASHNILNKRNAALASAYVVVDQSFKDYRKRVKERFGDQVDHELRHNIKAELVTVETDEDGNPKKENKVVEVMDSELPEYSDYARFFDEASPYWKKDPEYNLMFLKQTERYANERLRSEGFLFLNEVYESLGIPRTQAGQVVGWVYDEDKGDDNFVDFGIYDINKRRAQDFVNGYERCILLDFNVDGNVLKLMK